MNKSGKVQHDNDIQLFNERFKTIYLKKQKFEYNQNKAWIFVEMKSLNRQ